MNLEIIRGMNHLIRFAFRSPANKSNIQDLVFKKPRLLITPSANEEYPFMWLTNTSTEIESYQDNETPELMKMNASIVILATRNDWAFCDFYARLLISTFNGQTEILNSRLTWTNVVNITMTSDNSDYSDAEANAVVSLTIIYEDLSSARPAPPPPLMSPPPENPAPPPTDNAPPPDDGSREGL